MVSLLVLAVVACHQQESVPLQFVPKAQFAFERKDTILESRPGEPVAMILVNDEDVSNEILEAITKNADCVRLVELVRKEASGNIIRWNPFGRMLSESTIVLPANESSKWETGEVGMIFETSRAVGFPHIVTDKPTINCSVPAGKGGRTIIGSDKRIYSFVRIGVQKFKFSNIRMSIRVNSYAGALSAAPGTTKKISDIDFKVIGKSAIPDEKLEHFEVIQAGYQGMDNLSMVAQFDWNLYEKEVAPVRNRNEIVTGRLVRKPGEPVDYKDMHFDFPSAKPVKYFSEITVLRASSIQGFFQHIATEPKS